MKKEEIYVVIDSEEKRVRAIQILTDAGEKFWKKEKYFKIDSENTHLISCIRDGDWFIVHTKHSGIRDRTEITLDELEQFLKPKEEQLLPIALFAGDERVLVNGKPLRVDFRIISEENYQILTGESNDFPREMMVWNEKGDVHKEVVTGFFNGSYLVDYGSGYHAFKHASEIEPPKPSPIDEVIAFAEQKGVRITGGLQLIENEPEFVLPEKWAVKKTRENYNVINDWVESIHPEGRYWDDKSYIHSDILSTGVHTDYRLQDGFTEITFEQFQKYVLKS